jgi:hypothetical protein
MEKLLLYKNKSEIMKCQFRVDGAKPEDTVVRLCLEFDDNKNLFFYGDIDENGGCDITIPTLNDIKHDSAKLVIEAIADSTYFKVYEATVKLKNSVGVKLLKTEVKHTKSEILEEPCIKLESVRSREPSEDNTREPSEDNNCLNNPFIPSSFQPRFG